MPTYQYACTDCAERSEVVQKFTDEPLLVCSSCGGRLRKVFSPVGIVFKGSGFYRNDSRATAAKDKDKVLNGSSGAASATAGSSASSESSGSGSPDAAKNGGSSSGDKAGAAGSSGSSSSGSSAGSNGSGGSFSSSRSSSSSSSSGSKVA